MEYQKKAILLLAIYYTFPLHMAELLIFLANQKEII